MLCALVRQKEKGDFDFRKAMAELGLSMAALDQRWSRFRRTDDGKPSVATTSGQQALASTTTSKAKTTPKKAATPKAKTTPKRKRQNVDTDSEEDELVFDESSDDDNDRGKTQKSKGKKTVAKHEESDDEEAEDDEAGEHEEQFDMSGSD